MQKILLFIALLTPFGYLLFGVQGANDPIKYIYVYTGISALVLLMLSLAIRPLRRWKNLMRYRKTVGLAAFFYAALHFLNFFILDAQLDIVFVLKETFDKPFIYLGMITFIILLFMAITSTKKLFCTWNKWHKMVYIALILVTTHAAMAQKVMSSLEYAYIVATCMLLGYRFFVIPKT